MLKRGSCALNRRLCIGSRRCATIRPTHAPYERKRARAKAVWETVRAVRNGRFDLLAAIPTHVVRNNDLARRDRAVPGGIVRHLFWRMRSYLFPDFRDRYFKRCYNIRCPPVPIFE
jgi:hypothetical protein